MDFGNENSNIFAILLYPSWNGIDQETINTKTMEWIWGKGNLHSLLVRLKIDQLLWKSLWRTLKKLKFNLPYYLTLALLGIYLKIWTFYSTDTYSSMFIVTLSITA